MVECSAIYASFHIYKLYQKVIELHYLYLSISISFSVIVGYYSVDWSSLSEVTSSVL